MENWKNKYNVNKSATTTIATTTSNTDVDDNNNVNNNITIINKNIINSNINNSSNNKNNNSNKEKKKNQERKTSVPYNPSHDYISCHIKKKVLTDKLKDKLHFNMNRDGNWMESQSGKEAQRENETGRQRGRGDRGKISH